MRSSMFTIKIDNCQSENVSKSLEIIKKVLKEKLPGIETVTESSSNLIVFSDNSLSILVRFYKEEQIFSINIESTPSYVGYEKKLNNSFMTELKNELEAGLEIKNIERVPIIKRNNPVPLYFLSSDERVLEYDFDEIKFHERSKFQDVKILHSPSLGNTLILDELQNLAEGDLAYTQGLMKFGQNSYKGKFSLFFFSLYFFLFSICFCFFFFLF